MKKWWSSGSGCIELEIELDDAKSCSHPGGCDDDVEALSQVPYIKEQLDALDPRLLSDELGEYGAWDDTEEAHDKNLQRVLWLACCDLVEEEE